ncbi:MAG: dihydrolipoamide acetyltransferase family protein [Acidimicrobiales bacterium]
MADITMPQLGETVTEGTITKWFKKVGDQVGEDEPLFEVSTDKVDSEVPSSASGYVAEILVEEGQTVDVGVKLAVITPEQPGEGGAAAAPKAEEPSPEDEPEPEDAEPRPARAEAEAETEEAPPAAAEAGEATGASERTAGRLLSPVVRRLINEHDIDPDDVTGTGADGRITRADVLAYIDRNGGTKPTEAKPVAKRPAEAPAAAPAQAEPAPARAAGAAPVTPGQDTQTIPFSNMRRRTAEHMVRSKATSAHVLVATEVDYSAVEKARTPEREKFKAKEGFALTYLPFIARAVIEALAEFPLINASVGEDALIVHNRVNLAIAVDLNFEGLIVPVVHNADQLRLPALARSFADLARRARSKELSADDISGGTFTITNPGPFGTFLTFPVINQPQIAILSTDGIRKKPVAVELPDGTDAVAVHPVGMLGLSFDHRAVDGAYASAFLKQVKELLETRDWSQEL